MKLQHLITFLAIGLLLPLSAKAATYSADGVNYTYTAGNATSAVVASVDPNATSLIIHKNFTVGETTYTVGKIENGKIVSANATTVTFDGPWALESNISGTQFYNLSAVERYYVTNPNTNTSANDPETGEHYGKLQAGDDGVLYMWHSASEIHMLAYPCKKAGTSYTVPENVVNIQASAFRNNENLETINLNNQVRLIRNEAFAGCTNLTAINAGAENPYFETVGGVLFQIGTMQNGDLSKFYPAGVTYHKTLAAYPAGLPATSYEVPADVVILARSCFYGATNLQTVTFASGTALQEIREFAFNKCENLENLTIPATVQYINMAYVDAPINPMGTGAQKGSATYNGNKAYAASAQGSFNHCKKLKLAVDPASTYFKVEDDVLFSKDGTRLLRYGCTKTFPGYIVPRNVLWIDSYAFDCTQVAHVVLPSKLSEVSRNLFEDAKNLDFITIPPLVGTNVNYDNGEISDTRSTRKSINQDAFKGCDNLKEVFMMPENPPILHNADVFGSSNPTIYVKPNYSDKNITTNDRNAANYPSSMIQNDIPVTLNSGMATMCRDFSVQLGSNLKAYNIPNSDGIQKESNDWTLVFAKTNLSGTASSDNNGNFIPARTGEDFGDYWGVVLKTTDGSTSGTYQISIEDFANHFGKRGIYVGDGEGAYSFSYTFPDADLSTTGYSTSGTNVAATGGTISYNRIGGWNGDKTSAFFAVKETGKYYQKFGANEGSCYIILKRSTDSFNAGDKIYITSWSNSNNQGIIRLKNATTGNQIPLNCIQGKEITANYTLTADDIETDGSIKLVRGNTNTFIRNIQVLSPTKGNQIPRSLKESSYTLGTPVETNITVYDGDFTNFGLKSGKFQRVAADGMVKCNKAYLHLPNTNVPDKVPGTNEVASGAKFSLVFKDFVDTDFDDLETTGIQDVNAETTNVANAGIVYNLNGYPVGNAADLQQGNLPKGMYILNGKKYIVK